MLKRLVQVSHRFFGNSFWPQRFHNNVTLLRWLLRIFPLSSGAARSSWVLGENTQSVTVPVVDRILVFGRCNGQLPLNDTFQVATAFSTCFFLFHERLGMK